MRIASDIQLLLERAQHHGVTLLGVTGSNGKSTTTALIQHLLGEEATACSNIGYSAMAALSRAERGHILVVEASSYQMELSTPPGFVLAW